MPPVTRRSGKSSSSSSPSDKGHARCASSRANKRRTPEPSRGRSRTPAVCRGGGRSPRQKAETPGANAGSTRRFAQRDRSEAPCRRHNADERRADERKIDKRGENERSASPPDSQIRSTKPGSVKAGGAAGACSSFRDFVLRELNSSVGPEEAVAAFSKYQQKVEEQAVEPLRGTRLLFDLYHPLSTLRRFDWRIRSAQRNAQAFLEDVCEGRYAGLCLRGPPNKTGATCATAGHLQPPHYAFDPDTNGVLLASVPPAASVWDIHDALSECQGLAAVSWPKPEAGELLREVHARFDTSGHARAAVAAVAGPTAKGGQAAAPSLIEPSTELLALVAPPEMSHPERISKDAALAVRAAKLLDGLVGIRPELVEQLLQREQQHEARLDLLALYLRRVHHFCIYTAEWYEDEWDLRQHGRCAFLRYNGEAEPEGDWAQEHEQRLARFFEVAKLDRPRVPSSADEPIASRVATLLGEKTVKVADGKFRCMCCNKHFRGPEYVHKHLRKVHTDVLEAVRQQELDSAAWAACLADPKHPRVQVQGR